MKAIEIVVKALLQPKKIEVRLFNDTGMKYQQMDIELTKKQAMDLISEITKELKKLED